MRASSLVLLGLLSLGGVAAVGCSGDPDVDFPPGTTATTSSGGGGDATGGGGSGASTSTGGGEGGAGGGEGGAGGGAGGEGGAAPVCTPEGPFDGDPVAAPPGAWTWVPVPEARCRNGSATGFGVRMNPASDKLMIYLEGGGACFNTTSCVANPSSYAESNFNGWKGGGGQSGIFATDNVDNPVREWNAVFIPYCTGDIHGGDATGVDVPGIGAPSNQSFVGYANIGHDLKRILPTFPGVTEVLLTGVSAGGFGAAYNYDRIAQAFCPRPVWLIDDSGPPMGDAYLAPCLQSRWRDLWNLGFTLPNDCVNCTGPDGGGIVNYTTFLADKYPSSRLGLISSNRDNVISLFFGYGQNNCANIDGFTGPISGAEYTAGLEDLRDNHLTSAVWATYFIDSTQHTWIGGGSYDTAEVGGVRLRDWVGAHVTTGTAGHVGP